MNRLSAENLLAERGELHAETRDLLARAKSRNNIRYALLAIREGRHNVEAFARLVTMATLQALAQRQADAAAVDTVPPHQYQLSTDDVVKVVNDLLEVYAANQTGIVEPAPTTPEEQSNGHIQHIA